MMASDWIRATPLRELVLCLGVLFAVAAVALARLIVRHRRRMTREEPVLRCIRELRWEAAWAADAYRERLAKRLRAKLGIGARRYALRGSTQVDLSFDYQGTTWFIAVQERLPNLQGTRVQRDIAELLVDCTERRVERPTVAVVVGVPSGGRQVNPELRALRAALVCGAARPLARASSDFNYELVAVPLAGTSAYPPGAAGASPVHQ
jgi:hypothetical protein